MSANQDTAEIDIPEFCRRFGIDPSFVVKTPTGIRLRDVPTAEADRIIVSMMAAGLIAWLDDPELDDGAENDGITWVEDEADIVQPGGPAEAWARLVAEGSTW